MFYLYACFYGKHLATKSDYHFCRQMPDPNVTEQDQKEMKEFQCKYLLPISYDNVGFKYVHVFIFIKHIWDAVK